MPHIPGQWFPHENNPNTHALYCASMLALFKPWRDLAADLKTSKETFSGAFDQFSASTSEATKCLLSNIQYFHECSDKARQRQEEGCHVNVTMYAQLDIGEHLDNFDDSFSTGDDCEDGHDIMEDDILHASDGTFSTCEMVYADLVMNIAKEHRVFTPHTHPSVPSKPAEHLNNDHWHQWVRWEQCISRMEEKEAVLSSGTDMGAVQDLDKLHASTL